jgi:hypothetical protein
MALLAHESNPGDTAMTPRQADKIIKGGQPVLVRGRYNDLFQFTATSRDRRRIEGTYTVQGEVCVGSFDRGDLQLVAPESF